MRNFPKCDVGRFERRVSDGRNILVIGLAGRYGYAFDVDEDAPPPIPLRFSWQELLADLDPEREARPFSMKELRYAATDALRKR